MTRAELVEALADALDLLDAYEDGKMCHVEGCPQCARSDRARRVLVEAQADLARTRESVRAVVEEA